jgi:4-aminobutyrate aminotransferase-like enzyme
MVCYYVERLRKRFNAMQERFDIIGDVRGLGAMYILEEAFAAVTG